MNGECVDGSASGHPGGVIQILQPSTGLCLEVYLYECISNSKRNYMIHIILLFIFCQYPMCK